MVNNLIINCIKEDLCKKILKKDQKHSNMKYNIRLAIMMSPWRELFFKHAVQLHFRFLQNKSDGFQLQIH